MVEGALGALRISVFAITKLTPFEAHHRREADTVQEISHRNLGFNI